MKRNIFHASLAVPVGALIAVSGVAHGQIVGRATQQDWAKAGGDSQRTHWQRISPGSPASRTISPETIAGAKIDFSSPDEMSGFGLQLKPSSRTPRGISPRFRVERRSPLLLWA